MSVTVHYKPPSTFQWQMSQFRSNISDPNVVRDFPNDVLKEMAMDPAQPAKGPWSITLHPYLYRKFQEYCPDRALRWNAYRAKVNLGSGEYDDNSFCGGHVKEIRVQRQDQAAQVDDGGLLRYDQSAGAVHLEGRGLADNLKEEC